MAAEMTSRERVRTAIARKAPDRVPIYDGPWSATVERWRREGLPADQTSAHYFNYDLRAPRSCLSSQMTNEDVTPGVPEKFHHHIAQRPTMSHGMS